MRKIFEQGGKCCLRFKRSAFNLFGLGKCCLRFKRNTFNLFGWGKSYSKIKRTAFTLAEVLIVLGIIGIVASMTIPTLMNKVAKQEYVTGLRKAYSTQMDGWSRLLADEGVQQLEDTSVWQSVIGYCSPSLANDAACKPFFAGLKKYFRFSVVTAQSYQIYQLKGTNWYDYTGRKVLAFADGSVMFDGTFFKSADKADAIKSAKIAAGGGHMYSRQGDIYIDVNGFKKPNTYGRDIFEFWLSGDGKLYPYYGKDYSLYYGNLNWTWQNNSGYCGTEGSADASSVYGFGCAARIMDEGWQMNY